MRSIRRKGKTMDDLVRVYDNVEIKGSGLSEDMAKRLVSKRVDVDKMEPMEADNYARRIMSDISRRLWDAMASTHKLVRHCGFSTSEALIQLASNILEDAEEEVYENDAMNSLGIVGKTVYVYEEGTFDTPQKFPSKKTVKKNAKKKPVAKKK